MMLTPPQIAKRLGVAPDKVRLWIAKGELRATNLVARHGLQRPRWRVAEADLEAFMRRREAEPRIERSHRRPRPVVLDCPDYASLILRGGHVCDVS